MSKKTIVGVIAMCSLLLPVAAVAADGAAPAPSTIANQICKQEQVTLGANFKSTYGTNANKSNAFGKCVSKNAKNAQADVANAAKACDTERTADPAAFASKYGKNAKDKNAFGKCVSAKATASANAHAAAAAIAPRSSARLRPRPMRPVTPQSTARARTHSGSAWLRSRSEITGASAGGRARCGGASSCESIRRARWVRLGSTSAGVARPRERSLDCPSR